MCFPHSFGAPPHMGFYVSFGFCLYLKLLGIGRCDVFGGFLLLESHSCGSKDEGGVGKELHVSEVFWYFLFVIAIDLRLAFKYWKV